MYSLLNKKCLPFDKGFPFGQIILIRKKNETKDNLPNRENGGGCNPSHEEHAKRHPNVLLENVGFQVIEVIPGKGNRTVIKIINPQYYCRM